MVLSVAHRLVNIMDYDFILVLSSGSLHEAGHPHDLLCKHLPVPSLAADAAAPDSLANTDGIPQASFASLVLQTGPDLSFRLRQMAYGAKLALGK